MKIRRNCYRKIITEKLKATLDGLNHQLIGFIPASKSHVGDLHRIACWTTIYCVDCQISLTLGNPNVNNINHIHYSDVMSIAFDSYKLMGIKNVAQVFLIVEDALLRKLKNSELENPFNFKLCYKSIVSSAWEC